MDQKASLRQKIIKERKSFDVSKYSLKNKQVINNLIEIIAPINIEADKMVGGYLALPGEPDIAQIFEDYKDQWQFVLPKIEDRNDQMWFVRYKFGDQLEKSALGFMQPVGKDSVNWSIIPFKMGNGIIIAPGLAYSKNGYRLGFGRGYYDRYLSSLLNFDSIIKIGICFDEYLQDNLPNEKHDIKFDYIITDKRIIITQVLEPNY